MKKVYVLYVIIDEFKHTQVTIKMVSTIHDKIRDEIQELKEQNVSYFVSTLNLNEKVNEVIYEDYPHKEYLYNT